MTFDIDLHEVCVRVGVLYVITKFSRLDNLPNFLTHGAPLRARAPLQIQTEYSANQKIIQNFAQMKYIMACNSYYSIENQTF